MNLRRRFLVVGSALVALALGALLTAGSAGAAPTGVYAAYGDSYSSGEGNPPFIGISASDGCHRSAKAYSQLLVGTSGFPSTSDFRACSGATINDFINGMSGEASQLGSLNAGDSLVSLTLGGNDVGFTSTLLACMSRSHCQNSLGAGVSAAIATTATRLAALYASVLAAAPNAKVYVLGYPIFISPSPGLLCQLLGLAPDETAWMGTVTAQFDATIKATIAAVNSPRLKFVDTTNLFAGKAACSSSGADVNGVNLLHTEYSFHPTAAGQALLAGALAAAVRAG